MLAGEEDGGVVGEGDQTVEGRMTLSEYRRNGTEPGMLRRMHTRRKRGQKREGLLLEELCGDLGGMSRARRRLHAVDVIGRCRSAWWHIIIAE